MAAYAAALAALTAVASGLGVFARGDGSFVTVTSVRGVTYEMATSGVYAYSSKALVAEGIGWDVFTLLIVVPSLFIAAWLVGRGSLRGRYLALGLVGYLLYQYLEYALGWAIGPLFPLFIVIYAASGVGLVWFAVSVAREGVAERFASDFPRRGLVLLNVVMAVLLGVMWAGRIASALRGDLAAAGLNGETTLVVQALDLGLVLPVSLLVAALVWRRLPAGYALAAAYTVTAAAMAAAIVAMLVSASIVNAELALPPIVLFGTFGLLYTLLALRILRGMRDASA